MRVFDKPNSASRSCRAKRLRALCAAGGRETRLLRSMSDGGARLGFRASRFATLVFGSASPRLPATQRDRSQIIVASLPAGSLDELCDQAREQVRAAFDPREGVPDGFARETLVTT